MAESDLASSLNVSNANELHNSILRHLEMLLRDITNCILSDLQPNFIEDIHDHAMALYQNFAIVLDPDPDTYGAFLVQSRRLVDILQNVVLVCEN